MSGYSEEQYDWNLTFPQPPGLEWRKGMLLEHIDGTLRAKDFRFRLERDAMHIHMDSLREKYRLVVDDEATRLLYIEALIDYMKTRVEWRVRESNFHQQVVYARMKDGDERLGPRDVGSRNGAHADRYNAFRIIGTWLCNVENKRAEESGQ